MTKYSYMSFNISEYVYDNVSRVVNPRASKALESQEEIKKIEFYFPGLTADPILTHQGYAENVDHLGKSIPRGALAFIFSGDGVVNEVAAASILHDLDLTLVPTFAGNRNDLANTVHSADAIVDMNYFQENAVVEDIYPLKLTFEVPEECEEMTQLSQVMYALQYFGTGASGKAADNNNNRNTKLAEKLRQRDWSLKLFDAYSVIDGIFKARSFGVDIDGLKTTRRTEMLFINGESMAGVIRTPVKITDKKTVFVEARNRASTYLKFGKFVYSGIDQSKIIDSDIDYSYRVLESTWAHIDGQAFFVPGKTRITVKRSPVSIKVLVTSKN